MGIKAALGVALVIAPILAGCGLAARNEARTDYKASADQYKACLAANQATPQNCEGARLAMETDERKFNNMTAATNPEGQHSSNITIMRR